MKLRNNLQTRTVLIISVMIFIVVATIGSFVGFRNKKLAMTKGTEYTELLGESTAKLVTGYVNQNLKYFKGVGEAMCLTNGTFTVSDDSLAAVLLKNLAQQNPSFTDVFMVIEGSAYQGTYQQGGSWIIISANSQSGISYSNSSSTDNFDLKFGQALNSSVAQLSQPFEKQDQLCFNFISPISSSSMVKAYLGATITTQALDDLIQESTSNTEAQYALLTTDGVFVSGAKYKLLSKRIESVLKSDIDDDVLYKELESKTAFSVTAELNKTDYFMHFAPLSSEGIGNLILFTSVPVKQQTAATAKSIRYSVLVGLICLIILIYIVGRITHRISNPVVKVTNILEKMAEGDINVNTDIKVKTGDELESMTESVEKMIVGLKKTQDFAHEIGKGNYDKEYSLLGDADELGKALLTMRDNLKSSREAEIVRKKEEDNRNWATEGIAKFGETLRQDNHDMRKLGFNVMSNLVDYLKVNQGALFVLNESYDGQIYYELAAAIAYNREKAMNKEIRVGEGLVGRCVFEKKSIYMKEVPDNYVAITSGLGTANPNCILIVPCILNDEVYGVIELASFTELQKFEIEFVEKLGESIASTISSVRINEKTSKLLNDSKKQSEELAAQEEELRQNLEEMEATQEDLQRQMAQNNEMRENLRKQNALLDALLTSLPDYIYFKDVNSKFLRISDSMLNLFNAKTVDDVIGKSDFDYHTPENAKKYFEDEKEIMRSRKGFQDLLQKEITLEGEELWMSVTKLPIITAQGDVIGTFGISKNVTEFKRLEDEAKRQTQIMQESMKEMEKAQQELEKQAEANKIAQESLVQEKALLDAILTSLPDYIYFKDLDSKFLRISDSMLDLFNAKKVSDVIGKSDFDYHTPENAKQYYDDEQAIIRSGKGFTDQIQREIKPDGTVVWTSSSKMPLRTKNGDIIGTFGLSKNITNVKNLEIEAHKREIEMAGLLDAVKNASITVEYDTKGLITDVNEAYLKLFNLEHDEVIGTHHNDSYDSVKKTAAQYKNFWNDILTGHIVRQENTIMVGGKPVTLQETFTPVKDDEGKVIKVIKIAFKLS